MKKILYAIALLLVLQVPFGVVRAQVPQTFTYQAVVRGEHGIVANRHVGVQISILRGSEDGMAVYTETQTLVTNGNGLFTVRIGTEENPIDGIDWSRGPYFLKSEVDPEGGNNYTISTVQQMLSVPYALRAHVVDSIVGGVHFTEEDPRFTAWTKDYNDLTNKPHLFPGDYDSLINKPVLFSGDYNDLTNKPVLFSGDYNDLINKPSLFSGNYNDLTNKPTIPTVPTNVSAFTNDAGYLTSYTETDPQFVAWGKNYNELINKPTIPTVPTNVSAFANDAGYLTSYTETQELSMGNDTIYLTGGSFVKLPDGFSGDYNDLTNTPTIPTVPTEVSAFTNDAGYITANDLAQVLAGLSATIDSLGDSLAARTSRYDSIVGHFQQKIDDVQGRIDRLTAPQVPASALNGVFSVSASNQVRFSPGNLQYKATLGSHSTAAGSMAPGTWRFAEHQYDFVTPANNTSSAEDYGEWIDLFFYGTSGWNSGYSQYQPWSRSAQGGCNTDSLVGDNVNADWAYYNAISNGGDEAGLWRTLSKDEWDYLLNGREGSTIGNVTNARYAYIAIEVQSENLSGMVLFPDNYVHPNGLIEPYSINGAVASLKVYTLEQWQSMEEAGCVFLYAAGESTGTSLNENGGVVYCWTSTSVSAGQEEAYALKVDFLNSVDVFASTTVKGFSVRPVTDVR